MGYILLLEDSTSLGRTFGRVLRGSRLVWVQTGEAAIDQLEADSDAAVLLVDLQLGPDGLQGSDVLEIIQDRWPQLLPRTFLMTGHPQDDVAHMVPEGVGYVQKPLSISALRELVLPFEPESA